MKTRIYYVIIAAVFCLLLSACGNKEDEDDTAFSTLHIGKNGKVLSRIIEDFDEPYYYEDELKDMIEEEVSAYNKKVDSESITFKSCEKSENAIIVELSYNSAEDYTAFNGDVLFYGTVQDAYQAGYDLNVRLSDAANSQTIGKDDILNMGDNHIVISNENIRVACYKDIAYMSEGVTTVSKSEADLPETDTYNILILND